MNEKPRKAKVARPDKAKPVVAPETGMSPSLLGDIRSMIENARVRVASAVNSELVELYWRIGTRIRQDILHERRAEYGRAIVSALGRQLHQEFGPGFSQKVLRHMIRFSEVYPDEAMISALRRQLSWTHLREIIYLSEPLQREFYSQMCRIERWSTRTLHQKIQGMLYERTAISRKPAELARQELAALREKDRMTPDLVFRDPYVLDFLGLVDAYSEKDLETAILRELERFLLELGNDFAFLSRQKRIAVDGEDYYLDLLFYHRRLRRLVAIDLKLGRSQATDKGQMELYLRWLDENERQNGEDSPIGLILCAGKSTEHVRLLRLEDSHIRVAAYLTEMLPKEVLERKLYQAIQAARLRLDTKAE